MKNKDLNRVRRDAISKAIKSNNKSKAIVLMKEEIVFLNELLRLRKKEVQQLNIVVNGLTNLTSPK